MNNVRPLEGKRILVTRGKEQAVELSQKIKAAGGIPRAIPLIDFVPISNKGSVQQIIPNIDSYDWVIFTSKNGVDFFLQFLAEFEVSLENLRKIAVVGKKTAQTLKDRGIHADLVPKEFVAEGLIAELIPQLHPNEQILVIQGILSRPVIQNELRKMGYSVSDLIVYETIENKEGKTQLINELQTGQIDIITFTSSSTVYNFIDAVKGHNWTEYTKDCLIACIGPITKKAAEDAGIPIDICPSQYTIDDMLHAIEQHYRGC